MLKGRRLNQVNAIVSTAVLGFLAWLGVNMVEVKTELAVTHEKVANVEKMVQPIWEQYLLEKSGDKFARVNATTN